MTHPKERGWRKALSVVLHKCKHTHTHKHTVPAMMATSQAQREDLVVPHTCQKQMLRINQREAQTEEKLHMAITPLTHYTVR